MWLAEMDLMRVTSDFFVSALVRGIFSNNGFAAIPRKGAAEAGAIFIIVDRLDGSLDLYGPAPQSMFTELPQGRLFERVLTSVDRAVVTDRLDREARMDPDFWIVEIDACDGKVDLPLSEENDVPQGPSLF